MENENNDEVIVDNVEDNNEEETKEESKEESKVEKREETLEEKEARLARQLKVVRKKLGKEEEPKKEIKEEPKNDSNLSQMDVLVLAKADIHEDDMEEVIEFSRFKKISIAEALKNGTLKSILAEKAEFRKSAEMANAGTGKKPVNKKTPEALVDELSKGNVPEKGSKEAEELFWAKRGGQR